MRTQEEKEAQSLLSKILRSLWRNEMRHEQGQSPRLNCLDHMQGWLPAHPIWNPCCWDDWSRLAGVSTWSKVG